MNGMFLKKLMYHLSLDICHSRIQLGSAIVEFVFAPEERDVYSYERTPKDLAPLGAKPGTGTFALAKSDCAPTELRSKDQDRQAINISPLRGEPPNNVLLHFQVEFANDKCPMTNDK